MISADKAWQLLDPHLSPLPAELVERRLAVGRVLAEPVTATVDIPPCDVSAMDGYAVGGPLQPGERRPVPITIAAGDPPGAVLPEAAAAHIMTGAPVPAGADRIVPVELTDGAPGEVTFRETVAEAAHIRRGGEIVRAGDRLLPAGSPLTPGALALLAAHGFREVSVYRAPRVAMLATGNEVVPPEASPQPGQIRDSHTDFLLASGRALGLDFHSLGISGDDADSLAEHIGRGLDHDLLLICGGVSKGEYDLVEGVLNELGCKALFDAVAVQPGKPLVAAVHDRGLVFGLPGNPSAVMVCFWLFVRPAIRRLLGYADRFWHGALEAELAAPLPGSKARDRFLTAVVDFRDGKILVQPQPAKGSHDQSASARGSALVRIPAGSKPRPAGAPCEILPLADWRP